MITPSRAQATTLTLHTTLLSAFSRPVRRCIGSLLAAALVCTPARATDMLMRPWPAQTATPGLVLTDLTGKEWRLDSLRGKVVVLNFWASWCGPCIEELPILNEIAEREAARGEVVVLGVNYRESATAIQQFADAHPIRFPILRDRTGESFKQWTTNGIMPATILIDRSGRARWRVTGEISSKDGRFKQALNSLLR